MSYEEEKQDRKIEQLEIKIEWLQNANTNFVRRICDQAQEIERLRADAEQYERCIAARSDVIDQQATRIQELEDALVEERARALWFEGDDPCDPPNLDWKTEPNDIPESVRLLWGESARQQLQAEGKIGPDVKPQSWKITDERVEALKVATGEMDLSENIFYLNSLKTMLKEVGQ